MQGESRAELWPFAKESRTVSRYQPEENTSSSGHFMGDFVDRLAQQTSSCWMEEYREAPILLTSGCVAQRLAGDGLGPLPGPEISVLEKLPSPKELVAKKKRGLRRKRLENVPALSVFYHLEDLKRRQKDMDEQKADKWGSGLPQPFPRENPEGAAGDPSAEQELLGTCRAPPPAQPHWKDFLFGRGADIQLLRPEWDADLRAPPRSPGGRPPPGGARRWPEEGWEGAELQPEE